MSERHTPRHETQASPEHGHEASKQLQEVLRQKVEQARADAAKHEKSLDAARHEASKHAEEAASTNVESVETPSELHTYAGHQLLKSNAYKQLLSQARKRLPKRMKTMSRLMHQKHVEAVSEVSSKTVARPSGLLGGGIGAFIGSIGLLYASKNLGFQYNFSLFIVLFCIGFIAGLVVEFVVRLFRKRS